MSAKRPVHFWAIKNGMRYKATVETLFNGALPFGSIESDIPEQPETMQQLVDLRQKGYLIQDIRSIENVR
jgi:hypothetical protein